MNRRYKLVVTLGPSARAAACMLKNRLDTHATSISRSRPLMLSIAVAAALTMTSAATAQEFPSKIVRMVVAFPPGGGNDTVARMLLQPLSQALGQSVVVENRPGANTIIGMTMVARAPADGHTVLLGGVALVAALRANLPIRSRTLPRWPESG